MFVIADMEWVCNTDGEYSPTQLAAVKVDETWNTASEFDYLIKPRDSRFHDWQHVAYTGHVFSEFLNADSAYSVLKEFQKWLNDGDVILWWYNESERLFKRLVKQILKKDDNHCTVSINEHVYEFLSGQDYSRGNSYSIASARGISTKSKLKHCSKNDVRVMQELLCKIGYPQQRLLVPVERKQEIKPVKAARYQYDSIMNMVHSRNCETIIGIFTTGFDNLNAPIRKGYKPCDCCKEEYRDQIKQRNKDIINRCQYSYLYIPGSEIFHKRDCGMLLRSKNGILGAVKYNTVLKTGRTPCRICNPSADDEVKPISIKQKKVTQKQKTERTVNKETARAIKRQKVAVADRNRLLNADNLTETERNDIFTLTQPRFAFWVGQGYQNFHLHTCSKLHDVSNLRGFATYNDARRNGYTPCKKCKPSSKHDATLSIPITNRIRTDEKIEDLETLCQKQGYAYFREECYFNIETPVGKWKIDLSADPITLEHINLVKTPGVKTYHKQPRIFLSLVDTFEYIKLHDEKLARKKEEGTVFVKFISQIR